MADKWDTDLKWWGSLGNNERCFVSSVCGGPWVQSTEKKRDGRGWKDGGNVGKKMERQKKSEEREGGKEGGAFFSYPFKQYHN